MEVSLFSLVATAALPVVNVFVMCALGAAMAWKGILDSRARQTLSQLIFWIFVPALTFTTLADSVNLRDLRVWWILPFNVLVSIIVGLLIGWLFSRILHVEHWFRKHFMCSVALGNVGNLPLVLVSSICSTKTPFAAALGPQCQRLGIAYVAFGMWIAGCFQFCVAYNLLKKPEDGSGQATEPKQARASEEAVQMTTLTAGGDCSPIQPGDTSTETEINVDRCAQPESATKAQTLQPASPTAEEDPPHVTLRLLPLTAGLPSTHQSDGKAGSASWPEAQLGEAEGLLAGQTDAQGSEDERGRDLHTLPARDDPRSAWTRREKLEHWLRSIPWGSYFNCPTLAAIAGLTVGCVSILKSLLFGSSPPLVFVTQSLETMAGGMIPCMMLVLGASLAKGPGQTRLPARVVAGVLLVRLLVVPAIGTAVVASLLHFGAIRPPDPLFALTLLLVHATPTAINLQTVATLRQNGEAEMSALLCWQYLAALVSVPLWMFLFAYLTAGT